MTPATDAATENGSLMVLRLSKLSPNSVSGTFGVLILLAWLRLQGRFDPPFYRLFMQELHGADSEALDE
jgi:hypothetical protein